MIAYTPEGSAGGRDTFNDIIALHAIHKSDKTVYYLLDDNGDEISSITYAELFKNIILQAHKLRNAFKKGDRCILIFQPGMELIISLLACFYSGIIAVPVNPPKRNKTNKRFWAILSDCSPAGIMMDGENRELLEKHFEDRRELDNMKRISVERSFVNFTEEPADYGITAEDIAFLQYTSGSTGLPKGVMVSHGNLMQNSEVIRQSFNHDEELVVINWLPPFHDMGLIGNLLQPLYVGGSSVIMHPNTFLRSPFIWLKAITKYKGITTGCPNFALEYCVEKVSEEQKKELDFSSLKVMFCGSERVRKQSLDRFNKAFREQGFRNNKFLPCYGLAESTLMVSGIDAKEEPLSISISRSDAERNSIAVPARQPEDSMQAIGCGNTWETR
ncbi:MAG: AMP-binding protein [Bacteroidota bacterium]|nr:AMP-binding protein [Bacteroidota bacterium]